MFRSGPARSPTACHHPDLLLSVHDKQRLAYEGDPESSTGHLILPGSPDERLARLWEKYISKMFEHRRLKRVDYTQEDAVRWLAWLSNALTVRNVSEFQLDGFNTWPHFQRDKRRPEALLGRVPSYYRRPFWYSIGLYVYLAEAFLQALYFLSSIAGAPVQAGVLFGIAYVAASPGGGIPNQLLTGTLTAVAATALIQRSRIGPTGWPLVEKFTWSRNRFHYNLSRHIQVGLINGAVAGLIVLACGCVSSRTFVMSLVGPKRKPDRARMTV